jgi:ferredoxin
VSSRIVLCQIQDWQEVSILQCRSLQDEKDAQECFGCDACSRLCANCRKRKPVCPALDMCKSCLEKAVVNEGFLADAITIDWQVCMACKERLVYYNVYGLCLHCAAACFAKCDLQALEASSNGHVAIVQESGSLKDGDLNGLSDIEQIIVTLHRRDAYPMSVIGQVLGLSEEKISQIYAQVLQKIQGS